MAIALRPAPIRSLLQALLNLQLSQLSDLFGVAILDHACVRLLFGFL
jgi:hypothetical protein